MRRDLVAVGGELPGEGEHRRAVEEAVRDPGDQVRRARAERREADTGDAGARGHRLGDEAGTRLVPREDELEPGLPEALDEIHDLAAGMAEDVAHAGGAEPVADEARDARHGGTIADLCPPDALLDSAA